jgi:hypothetical protein
VKHFSYLQLANPQCWDRYKAFHVTRTPIVHFSTGEVMVTTIPALHQRRHYDSYGIALTSTADSSYQFYLDKDCTQGIPKAWITQGGQQHVAIDFEQKVVTRIQPFLGKNKTNRYLPEHLQTARALWMGPNRLPVALDQIEISRPDKDTRRSFDSKALDEVKTAVTAACRILTDVPRCWTNDKAVAKPCWVGMTTSEIMADLSTNRRKMAQVAKNGIAFPRAESKQDFIYIK